MGCKLHRRILAILYHSLEGQFQLYLLYLESYPEQCRIPDGKSFTRLIADQQNLQQETIEEIGLSFQYPANLVYRKEIADNDGNIRTAGFFLTKGSEQNPEYQLYGLYENYRDATEADLERAKTEMDPTTVKEVILTATKVLRD